MASKNSAWGIEIGQYAIKAIQLEVDGSGVRVRDFAVIQHEMVLTSPECTADSSGQQAASILEMSLSQLATQKKLEGKTVIVSFNWLQNRGFARFCKLPPVDNAKQIENLVRYEAEQQIPYPLEEVEWDFHRFSSDDSPEVDVGIFAIQRDPLEEYLALVSDKLGIAPAAVSLAPVALYNALTYDRDIIERGETAVFLDIGTSATDLVVADGSRCWMRTFPLGGHDFTEAIAAEFKFPYRKSDDLKKTSATSDYAKQVMTAMRPVFGDLIGDVQKSLQHYERESKGTKLRNIVGLGSTLKIPGLRKFLGMQLNLDVERLDKFNKLSVEGPESADFAQHTVNFAIAYGLALQGLGLATIEVNLLPVAKMRQQVWNRKTRWFAGAAAVACAAGGLMFLRGILDNSAVGDVSAVTAAERAVNNARGYQSELSSKAANIGSRAKNMFALVEDREVWPFIVGDAVSAVAAGNDQISIGDAFEKLSAKERANDESRRQTLLRDLAGAYKFDGKGARVIEVTMNVEINAAAGPDEHLNATVGQWLRDHAKRDGIPYTIENVKWTHSKMKVGADGSMSADAASSAGATAPAGAPPATEQGAFAPADGSFSAPSGGGGGGNAVGGVTGKRKQGGGTINRPGGGRLGGAGMGSGFSGSVPEGGEVGGNDGASNPFNRDPNQDSGKETEKVDLDKIAPIPARPALFPPDSFIYVGKITFDVRLPGTAPVAADAAAGMEGQ